MSEALTVKNNAEAEPKRRALGPSEHAPQPGLQRSAIDRLVGRANAAKGLPQRRSMVREALVEELMAVGSFGGSEIHEGYEALDAGHTGEAVGHFVQGGVGLHHAFELVEKLALVGGEHVAMGPGGVALIALGLTITETTLALSAIADAHSGGERDGAMYKYAEVYSKLVANAVFDGALVRPEREVLPYLDEARGRAVHDAFETLRTLGGRGLVDALKQELGTPTNARRALMDAVLTRAGVRGLINHESAVR